MYLPSQFSEVYADSANDRLERMQNENLLKYGGIVAREWKVSAT